MVGINIVPKMTSLPQSVKDEFIRRNEEEKAQHPNGGEPFFYSDAIQYKNQLAMVYPNNSIYGWVASPSDVFENDWIILN